jgi:hypothetical protein
VRVGTCVVCHTNFLAVHESFLFRLNPFWVLGTRFGGKNGILKKKGVNSTNFANFWEKKNSKVSTSRNWKNKKTPNPRGWNFLLFTIFPSKIICEIVLLVWLCLLFFQCVCMLTAYVVWVLVLFLALSFGSCVLFFSFSAFVSIAVEVFVVLNVELLVLQL